MTDATTFADLLQRIRAGDMQAAAEFVRLYEPTVRRAIRVRMLNPKLRRTMDSMDVCQSVLGSFFVRAALGQFELETADDLIKLLVRLARNKVANVARQQQAAKRDVRRVEQGGSAIDRVMAQQESPSQIVEGADLLRRFREKLNDEERYLADQRALGREWADLGKELNQGPEGLRKRLDRAVERVARDLGLDEVGDE